MDKFTCCICGKEVTGWGNNPEPYAFGGQCCDECNMTYVIPARMAEIQAINDQNANG